MRINSGHVPINTDLHTIGVKHGTGRGIDETFAHIESAGPGPVPMHLRDKTSNAMQAQHDSRENPSDSYKYPHEYPGAWVDQQYLPEGMESPHWYEPKQVGYERSVYERFANRSK